MWAEPQEVLWRRKPWMKKRQKHQKPSHILQHLLSQLQLLPLRPCHLMFPWSQSPVVFHGPFPGMEAASSSHGSGCSHFWTCFGTSLILKFGTSEVPKPCRPCRPRSDREYTVLESSLASWSELISSFVAFITQHGTSLADVFVCLGHYNLTEYGSGSCPLAKRLAFLAYISFSVKFNE